nr:hypothetical protein GCM10020092_006140 [Actinoplanes digitatis]
MTGGAMPDPFAGSEWTPEPPRPVVPTPAIMGGRLRGRRVLIGLPGHGWRGDLRADEKVVQGSRTYVPVMPEAEWYRAEAEQTEVFAPLVPVERVWVEELGMAGLPGGLGGRPVADGVAGRASAPQSRRRPGRRRADRPPGRAAARGRRRAA